MSKFTPAVLSGRTRWIQGVKLPVECQYHADPEIDANIRQEVAEGETFALSVGLKAHGCPRCGRDHQRGWIDGDGYRCLHCGEVFFPADTETGER